MKPHESLNSARTGHHQYHTPGRPACARRISRKSMNEMTLSTKGRLLTQLATVPAFQTSTDGADWFPPVDIAEDAEEYLFTIDLPEVNPENLRLAVEEDALVICGERANPRQGDRKLLRIERPHGYFVRRFALPDDANRQEITPVLTESVLELHVRKVGSGTVPPAPTDAQPKLRLRSTS